MALDKLVDSAQLDADLTSVADAIRTKGGTSAPLAFPADFVTAIGDISGGGEQGLWDVTFNYTNGTQTWSGVVEDNTIKNFSGSAYCSAPLLLKEPILLSTNDHIVLTTNSSNRFFADCGFMHPLIYLAGRDLGKINIGTNYSLPTGSGSATIDYTGSPVVVDRLFIYCRTAALSNVTIAVSLSINDNVVF